MQQEVGHLGIFVSGKVAQKEYTQIVSVMKSIELAAAGPLRHGDPGAQGGRQGGLRSEVPRVPAGRSRSAAESPRAGRREAFRGGRRRFGIQPARVRALRCSPSFRRRRTSSPPARSVASIPCARSAGRCRTEPLARVAAGRRASREGEPPGAAGGQSAAPRRGEPRGSGERHARVPPGAASTPSPRRCSSMSTATCSRSTSPTGRRCRRRR